jgi:hypothetical protein
MERYDGSRRIKIEETLKRWKAADEVTFYDYDNFLGVQRNYGT